MRKKRTSLTANIDSLSSAKPQDLQTILGNSTGYQNLCIYIRKFHPANDTCVVKVLHFYGETEAKSVKQVINPFRLCQGNNFTFMTPSQQSIWGIDINDIRSNSLCFNTIIFQFQNLSHFAITETKFGGSRKILIKITV